MLGRIKWYDPDAAIGALLPDDGGGTVLIVSPFDIEQGDHVDVEWELRPSGRAVVTALTKKGST